MTKKGKRERPRSEKRKNACSVVLELGELLAEFTGLKELLKKPHTTKPNKTKKKKKKQKKKKKKKKKKSTVGNPIEKGNLHHLYIEGEFGGL